MKIDLTTLTREQQLALVILHLGKKLAGRKPGDCSPFTVDLTAVFKHHGVKNHWARRHFFGELLHEAVNVVIVKGGGKPLPGAEPIEVVAHTDGTPPPAIRLAAETTIA